MRAVRGIKKDRILSGYLENCSLPTLVRYHFGPIVTWYEVTSVDQSGVQDADKKSPPRHLSSSSKDSVSLGCTSTPALTKFGPCPLVLSFVNLNRKQCQVKVESSSINKDSTSATFLGSNPGRTAIIPTSFVSRYQTMDGARSRNASSSPTDHSPHDSTSTRHSVFKVSSYIMVVRAGEKRHLDSTPATDLSDYYLTLDFLPELLLSRDRK
ncbi:hypothetical protein J6590_078778 [Homalodisca vitripennis]|nr:hypothetical protein J6590_078778 [Homalodisca vitripennis]